MDLKNSSLLRLRMINFFAGMAQAVNALRMVFLTTHGLSAMEASVVLSLACVSSAIAPTISGMIADKIRSKYAVYMVATVGCVAMAVLTPASVDISIFGTMLASVVIPFFMMFMMPNYSLIESASVTATMVHPNLEYSSIRLLMSLGFTLSSFLYTPIIRAFGVDAAFYFAAFYFCVQLALSGVIKKYEYAPASVVEPALGEAAVQAVEIEEEEAPKKAQKLDLSRIFKNGYLVLFLLGNVLYPVGANCTSFLPYLLTSVGADTALVGLASAVRVGGEVLMLLLMPKLRKWFSLPLLQAVCGTLCILELTMYALCKSFIAALLVHGFGGMAWAISVGSSVVYVRMMAPEGLENTTVSLWYAVSAVCGLVSMLTFGMTIENYGVLTMYTIAMICQGIWLTLYLGGYAYMRYVKRVPPVQRMFAFGKSKREAA